MYREKAGSLGELLMALAEMDGLNPPPMWIISCPVVTGTVNVPGGNGKEFSWAGSCQRWKLSSEFQWPFTWCFQITLFGQWSVCDSYFWLQQSHLSETFSYQYCCRVVVVVVVVLQLCCCSSNDSPTTIEEITATGRLSWPVTVALGLWTWCGAAKQGPRSH